MGFDQYLVDKVIGQWSVVSGLDSGHSGQLKGAEAALDCIKRGHWPLLVTDASDVGVTLRGVRTKQS